MEEYINPYNEKNCEIKNLQINENQIRILTSLINFYEPNNYKSIMFSLLIIDVLHRPNDLR